MKSLDFILWFPADRNITAPYYSTVKLFMFYINKQISLPEWHSNLKQVYI